MIPTWSEKRAANDGAGNEEAPASVTDYLEKGEMKVILSKLLTIRVRSPDHRGIPLRSERLKTKYRIAL